MKKRYWALLAACLLLVLLASCQSREDRIEPEFVFRYAENQTEDYPTTLAGKYFAERVKELTNGRIEIIVYADELLGDERSVIEQLRFGGIDFSRLNLSPLAELDARYYVLQLPYLYDSSEHMWRVLDSDIGERYIQIAGDSQLCGLAWVDAGARSFYSRAPIHALEDMAGLRIRVQENMLMQRLVESLGALSQQMRYGIVLSALQTGEIDSAENNIPSYLSMGHYLIAKYFIEDEHTRIPEMIVASQVTMEKLSAQDREIIQRAAHEAGLYQRELWSAYEKSAREQIVKGGSTIITLSPETMSELVAAVSIVYDEFVLDRDDVDTVEKIRQLKAP